MSVSHCCTCHSHSLTLPYTLPSLIQSQPVLFQQRSPNIILLQSWASELNHWCVNGMGCNITHPLMYNTPFNWQFGMHTYIYMASLQLTLASLAFWLIIKQANDIPILMVQDMNGWKLKGMRLATVGFLLCNSWLWPPSPPPPFCHCLPSFPLTCTVLDFRAQQHTQWWM